VFFVGDADDAEFSGLLSKEVLLYVARCLDGWYIAGSPALHINDITVGKDLKGAIL